LPGLKLLSSPKSLRETRLLRRVAAARNWPWGYDIWKNNAPSKAAPLRLGEKWASSFRRRFSPRRKGAKGKRPLLRRHLILKDHKRAAKFTPSLRDKENALSVQISGNDKD
jgi:hypothetical protein